MARDIAIQMGLHYLTGRMADVDTTQRMSRLQNPAFGGALRLGLAIHAFGDSFAHRMIDDPARMYPPLAGHGIEAIKRNPHSPDRIDFRPALYHQYADALYDIICARTPGQTRGLPKSDLGRRLDEVIPQTGERAQISKFRELSERVLNQAMNGYFPENETTDVFTEWQKAHQKSDSDLTNALTYASAWQPIGN
jgi:hypothetical protein